MLAILLPLLIVLSTLLFLVLVFLICVLVLKRKRGIRSVQSHLWVRQGRFRGRGQLRRIGHELGSGSTDPTEALSDMPMLT